jgi:hypothetical protein
MKTQETLPSRFVLPLPSWVLKPYTAIVIAVVHIYLSVGHLSKLFGGDVQWTHFWKGFGSLGGAYVFAALATRGFARYEDHRHLTSLLRPRPGGRLDHHEHEARLAARVRVR